MKQTKRSVLLVTVLAALLCLLVFSVGAYDGTEYGNTGIYYEIQNGEAVITDAENILTADIPESIEGCPVTSIGSSAFYYCTGLTSITIPDGVTSIGSSAFSGCSGLTSVTIPDGVTSIGSSAFEYCSGLTSITIPDGVTSIGSQAFSGCKGLTSVTIPNSVTSIGFWAFCGCTGLTKITIPNGVTSIGRYAFGGCTSLTIINWNAGNVADFSGDNDIFSNAGTASGGIDVVFGDNVKNIPSYLFYSSSSAYKAPKIKSVTIGNSVTSIGSSAFYDCRGLTSVTIGNSVTSIGSSAFSGCSGLTSITIPDGVTSIGSSAFSGCSGLTSVTIGNSVTSIGSSAFEDCSGLTSVTIGNSVTSIGSSAFEDCSGLTSITIPDGVTSIGDSAFYGCSGLASVTIGNSVTSIGDYAFSGCASLTKINWNAENVADFEYNNRIFSNAGANADGIDVVFGDNVKSIPSYLFYSSFSDYKTPKIKSVTIGNSVTSIGSYAFCGCTSLTKINWNAENVADFKNDNKIFSNAGTASGGIDVVFGDNVKSIPSYLFYSSVVYYREDYKTPKIKSVTIGNSVTSIGDYAFYGCSGLTSLTIPGSVTSIGESAFNDTPWYHSQPYGDVYLGSYYYGYKGTMLQNTRITIREGTKGIAGGALRGFQRLKGITIPDSVTSIGSSAFEDCSGLTSITIPDGVTSIGTCAFKYCDKLTSITIPDSVKSIGSYAFSGCKGLKSVTIPNGVTSISDGAFYGCSGLTNITIPNSVTSIGDEAFYGCSGLTSITIPDSVETIGVSAFSGCRLTEIKIGKGLKSVEKNAFSGINVIPDVYYAGSEEEWKSVSIDTSNDLVLRAVMYYNADIYHVHSYAETIEQKATCTKDGVRKFTCSCGDSYTESIPALGHTFVTDKAVAATCTKTGLTEGSHCSVCGKVLVAQKTTKALAHKLKTTTTKATSSKDGKSVTSCTACGKVVKTAIIYKASSVKLSKTAYTYNGKAQKPTVTVKNSKGEKLKEGRDYTVKYQSGRKKPGKYTVTITFKGDYSGTKTLNFTIAPKAPTLKAKAGAKKATLSWNKQTGATGYNVYMATKKNGKYKKIGTVKNGKLTYTKSGLTKGKTYYFKVAAYTVSGGKTISGAYSSVKSAKVK